MDRAPIDLAAVRTAVAHRYPRIDVVEVTASTNADLLSASAADRTVLVAEHQTSGRGRFDRTWVSPPRAGLTFSVLLRPGVPLARWGWLPLLAGVAGCEAVREVAHLDATLKWPNDVLSNAAKLAGILVQTDGDAVVIGVGCNVSTTSSELPVEAATSVALCGVEDVTRTQLLIAMLTHLDARTAQWDDSFGDAVACGLAAAYRELCDTLGRPARVTRTDGTVVEGEAVDIDENGHLVLRAAGATVVIGAGDVEHLRPA